MHLIYYSILTNVLGRSVARRASERPRCDSNSDPNSNLLLERLLERQYASEKDYPGNSLRGQFERESSVPVFLGESTQWTGESWNYFLNLVVKERRLLTCLQRLPPRPMQMDLLKG